MTRSSGFAKIKYPVTFMSVVFFFAFVCQGFAQTPGEGQYTRNLPDTIKKMPEVVPQKKPGAVILPTPKIPPKKEQMLSTVPLVFVEKFNFKGNTVISGQELNKTAEPYLGKKVSIRDLHDLKNKLTRYYIDKGYINSGVILPDQKIVDDTVTYEVIEGRLTDIRISGNKRIRQTYIIKRLMPDQTKVFNIITLQEKLQLLHLEDIISRINGELSPGLKLGEATLDVKVDESNPFKTAIQLDNGNSPSSGSEAVQLFLGYMNLTGWGDAVEGRYKHTEGADEIRMAYTLPVLWYGTQLNIFYEYTESEIIERPFDVIDITSESSNWGLNISHPFIKTLDMNLTMTLTGEKRNSETFLYNDSFSFSENTPDGEQDIFVSRLAIDFSIFRPTQVFAVRSVVSTGLDILDTTDFIAEPDENFFTWLGQAQYARRFDFIKGDQLIVKGVFQLANDPIPSMERFSVGGFSTVRGYRENQLVRDNGLAGSIEYRFPVIRIPFFNLSETMEDGMVQLAPFADWGRSWNEGGSADILSSVGMGVRYEPFETLHFQVYYGYGLQDMDNSEHDLQDSGIHFLFRWDIL